MNLRIRPHFFKVKTALFSIGIVSLITSIAIPPKNPIQDFTQAPVAIPIIRESSPSRIQIDSTIDLSVREMDFGIKGWGVASDAASLASTSAYPSERGNIVMYSHNKRALFGPLHQVKIGSTVRVTTEDNRLHEYTVSKRHIVDPSDIDVLRPTETEVLTLYTCTGLFDSQRLVIQAIPKQ